MDTIEKQALDRAIEAARKGRFSEAIAADRMRIKAKHEREQRPKPVFDVGDLVELAAGERLYISAVDMTPDLQPAYQLGMLRSASVGGCYSENQLKLVRKLSAN